MWAPAMTKASKLQKRLSVRQKPSEVECCSREFHIARCQTVFLSRRNFCTLAVGQQLSSIARIESIAKNMSDLPTIYEMALTA